MTRKFTETATAPALNSTWVCGFDKQTYKVVGFKTINGGRVGVEIVRFIKSRGAWAKTPVCCTYLNTEIGERDYDHFYKWFPLEAQS